MRPSPGAPLVLHSVTFRLSYADTDPAGILYYAAWFPWMERVQSEWFFLNGLRQDTLAERFGFWTVTRRTEAEYLVPVGLYDEIRLDLSLGRVGGSSFELEHQMHRIVDDRLVGRGAITVVTIDLDGASVPIPEELMRHLDRWRANGR